MSDAETPGYTGPPRLFSRVTPIASLTSFDAAAAAVTPEIIPISKGNRDRGQGQLLGVDQVLTGSGFLGTPNDLLRDMIPAGQAAGWRSTPGAIRILVDVTDQNFDNLQGAPTDADGDPDVAGEGAKLAAQGVRHVGLVTYGRDLVVDQLAQLSIASGTFVPDGGLACGGLLGDETVPAGAGLVCTDTQAGTALQAAVDGYPHTGPMVITAGTEASSGGTPVFGALTGQTSTQADAWKGGTADVTVPFSCPKAGTETRHDLPLAATYNGTQIATGTATVTCLATGATTPDAVPPPAPSVALVSLPPVTTPPSSRPVGPAPKSSPPASSPPAAKKKDGAAPTAVALGQAPPPPAVVPAPAVAPAAAPAPAPAAAPVPAPVAAPGGAPAQAAAAAAAPAAAPAAGGQVAGQVAAAVAPQPGLAFGIAEQEQQLALARQQADTTPSDHNGDPTAYVTWLACLVLLFGGVTALHLQRQHTTTRPATVAVASTLRSGASDHGGG